MVTVTQQRRPLHDSSADGAPMPSIWCPLVARLHPQARGLDDHIVQWARRNDLVRSEAAAAHFNTAGFGQFAALVYPRATRLDLVAQWQIYNWIVDDRLDEGHLDLSAADRERIVAELDAQLAPGLDAPRPTGPLSAALADLWARTAEGFSTAWRERFRLHYRDFLMFTILPHADRARYAAAHGLLTFIRRRRLNSGCEMSFDLIEVANDAEVPAPVAGSDAYRSVRLAANDAVSWTNDIFSVRKELARGDRDHLAAVLHDSTDAGWRQALERAAHMVEQVTADFLEACQDLRALREVWGLEKTAWTIVDDSLDDLGSWIAGSLAWHRWSPRYRDVDHSPADHAPAYIEGHLA